MRKNMKATDSGEVKSWSYLWLNLSFENEIMHFEEEFRCDVQRSIGWIWSDVSGRETRISFPCSAPAVAPGSSSSLSQKSIRLFLVIFSLQATRFPRGCIGQHQAHSALGNLIRWRCNRIATALMSWHTFGRKFHHDSNDFMGSKVTAQAIKSKRANFDFRPESFHLDVSIPLHCDVKWQ